MSINPMQSAHDAPRCKAKSKRTGLRCRSPAVNGYRVCRMHGAGGGAPEGKRNGSFRHGGRTREDVSERLAEDMLKIAPADVRYLSNDDLNG